MDIRSDKRIKEYRYLQQLKEYLSKAEKMEINGQEFVYPRQLEIHLPGDGRRPCNAHCSHCFGSLYQKDLGKWEVTGLELLHNLDGAVPFQIYGGAYTEPVMNSYLYRYLALTKTYENHFGIHTNGTYLNKEFLKFINEISTDRTDYLSISLDAGSGASWSDLKSLDSTEFWKVLSMIEYAVNIRKDYSHAVRIVCLMTRIIPDEIEFVVSFAKMVGVDSVRFSIPYDYYNRNFEDVKKYYNDIECKHEDKFEKIVSKYQSKSEDEIPYIFWNPPYFTDINRFDFDKCFYGYFQITLGADGYVYPCSAVAAPTAKHLRVGEITSDLMKFHRQIAKIQNDSGNVRERCFAKGLRGNRMALEINEYYNKGDQCILPL